MTATVTGASTGLHLSDCRSFLAAFFSECRPSLMDEVMKRHGGSGSSSAARPVKPEDYAAFLDGLADVLLEALVRAWSMFMTDMDHRTTFALLMTSKEGIRRVAARKAPMAIRVLCRDAGKVSHRAPPLDARLDAGCFRVRWEVDDSAEPEHNPCAWLHVPLTMADLARRLSPAQSSRVAELCRDDSPFVVLSDVAPLIRECRRRCGGSSGCTREVTDKAALRVLGETHIAALQCCTSKGARRGARRPSGSARAAGARRTAAASASSWTGRPATRPSVGGLAPLGPPSRRMPPPGGCPIPEMSMPRCKAHRRHPHVKKADADGRTSFHDRRVRRSPELRGAR